MKVTVLLSCMHEKDFSIVEKSNIQTDAVVINQCNEDGITEYEYLNKVGKECHVKFINTTERGLSRSRNMAIANAPRDCICLICDDDEQLYDDYEKRILDAYKELPMSVGVVAVYVRRCTKKQRGKRCSLNIINICKTSSVDITFKINMVRDRGVRFDVKMGSGTGNGAGEENKFLMDCRRVGMRMYYIPATIGELMSYDSKWFQGYNDKYFENLGWSSRRIFGPLLGYLFSIYELIVHYQSYSKEISFLTALKNVNIGFAEQK